MICRGPKRLTLVCHSIIKGSQCPDAKHIYKLSRVHVDIHATFKCTFPDAVVFRAPGAPPRPPASGLPPTGTVCMEWLSQVRVPAPRNTLPAQAPVALLLERLKWSSLGPGLQVARAHATLVARKEGEWHLELRAPASGPSKAHGFAPSNASPVSSNQVPDAQIGAQGLARSGMGSGSADVPDRVAGSDAGAGNITGDQAVAVVGSEALLVGQPQLGPLLLALRALGLSDIDVTTHTMDVTTHTQVGCRHALFVNVRAGRAGEGGNCCGVCAQRVFGLYKVQAGARFAMAPSSVCTCNQMHMSNAEEHCVVCAPLIS